MTNISFIAQWMFKCVHEWMNEWMSARLVDTLMTYPLSCSRGLETCQGSWHHKGVVNSSKWSGNQKKSHRKGGNSSELVVMEGHGSGCLRDSIMEPFISKLGSEGRKGVCQKDKEGQAIRVAGTAWAKAWPSSQEAINWYRIEWDGGRRLQVFFLSALSIFHSS